jgi:hypothetical protein
MRFKKLYRIDEPSREREALERKLAKSAEIENENGGSGLGLGWLIIMAVPAWALIGYFAWRLFA